LRLHARMKPQLLRSWATMVSTPTGMRRAMIVPKTALSEEEARRPPHPSSHSSSQFADDCARKHPVHPPVHSFAPTCSSFQRRKNSSRPVPTSLRQHRWHAQISIAVLPHRPPAAPKAHYLLTRFRALALFRHRLVERVGRSVLPASESLAQEETYLVQQMSNLSRRPADSTSRNVNFCCLPDRAGGTPILV
jgi:hypothetical protein